MKRKLVTHKVLSARQIARIEPPKILLEAKLGALSNGQVVISATFFPDSKESISSRSEIKSIREMGMADYVEDYNEKQLQDLMKHIDHLEALLDIPSIHTVALEKLHELRRYEEAIYEWAWNNDYIILQVPCDEIDIGHHKLFKNPWAATTRANIIGAINKRLISDNEACYRLATVIYSEDRFVKRGRNKGITFEEALDKACDELEIDLGIALYDSYKSWRGRNKELKKTIAEEVTARLPKR